MSILDATSTCPCLRDTPADFQISSDPANLGVPVGFGGPPGRSYRKSQPQVILGAPLVRSSVPAVASMLSIPTPPYCRQPSRVVGAKEKLISLLSGSPAHIRLSWFPWLRYRCPFTSLEPSQHRISSLSLSLLTKSCYPTSTSVILRTFLKYIRPQA